MDVGVTLDPSAGSALHLQVYHSIRKAILTGRLRPGTRLPATRSLAEQLSVSRATVSEAYDQLQAEGYVQGKHGSGTYVALELESESLPSSGLAMTHRTVHPFTLSSWGRRVVEGEQPVSLRMNDGPVLRWDLRPHRVAQDEFPWHAWQSALGRAMGKHQGDFLSYPPSAGHPVLREAITVHISTYRGVICDASQVVVVSGTQQGFNLLAQLLLERGDRVAVEDPGYPAARLAFEARDLDVARVPVDSDGMQVEGLPAAPAPRMIHVTPSHQDPTGATMSLSRRLSLIEFAERHDALVLEDDYDSEFRFEGRPVESLQGLDHTGSVVYAGTFSKSVLPSLRIGFLVLPGPLVRPFVAAKSLWDSGAPLLEQAALAEFLRSGDFERHIRRMRRLYRTRRDALVRAIALNFGARAIVGQRHGGLNLLVSLNIDLSEVEVLRRASRVGVGLRGASSYYRAAPPGCTLLLGFGASPEAAIEDGVRQLASAVLEA